MQWKQATALVLGTWALCGCTTVENEMWGLRYGPQPVLVNEVVQTSMQRQLPAVAAVSSDIDTVTGQRIALAWPARQDRREWYTLILRGFNTIDDACMSYVDSLWIMERQKTRNSTILYAAGAAGAALIAAAQTTPSTAAALVVLSQAFGFAGVLNNAVFDTYLYSQNASTIKRIIQKTTLEYRSDLAENIGGDEVTYPIASVGAAYHHMREYLALCLPPTIQAQIDERLNGAKAIPEGPGGTTPKAKAAPLAAIRSGGSPGRVRPSTAITLQ